MPESLANCRMGNRFEEMKLVIGLLCENNSGKGWTMYFTVFPQDTASPAAHESRDHVRILQHGTILSKLGVGTGRATLQAHRRGVIDRKAAQYGGRTIKLMGDGALMKFASLVETIDLAVEVALVPTVALLLLV